MLEHAQPKGERARLSEKLIENALNLTGKTMEDILNDTQDYHEQALCYYLLSPEFIEKYDRIIYPENIDRYPYLQSLRFWQAITEYQSGNEKPLIELLSEIKPI